MNKKLIHYTETTYGFEYGSMKVERLCSDSNWVSKISCNNKTYNLGRYDCEITAAKAYDKKAAQLFGDKFAYFNFPAQAVLNKHRREV